MRFFTIFLGVFLCSIGQLFTQSCPNAGFEEGNFNGWSGMTGRCCPIVMSGNGIVNGRHTIMTGSGRDPHSCDDITVVPPGRTHSARLGNSGTSAQAERLSYTYEVSADNALFVYDYAVVMQDPNHDESDQPRFEIRVLDSNGELVSPQCGYYSVTAAANIDGFRSCGNIRYRAWTPVGIDLSAYIGSTITIEFSTGDCDRGGHFGYAYLTGKCSPLKLDVAYCPANSNVAVITAPAGFTYKWASGETTRSISVNSPPEDFTTTCILTAVTGCQVTLSADIRSTAVIPGFSSTESCAGQEVLFTDESITNLGEFDEWDWDFGDGTTLSGEQNPVHTFPGAGIYNVSLALKTNTGCNARFNKLVEVNPFPRSAFSSSTTCIGDLTRFNNISPIPETISQWEWDFGDGNRNTQQWNPTHLYASPGEYPVSLILFSQNQQCTDTFQLMQVVAENPAAHFSSDPICFGLPIEFTNTGNQGMGQSAWDFGDNSPSSYVHSPIHTYPSPGDYLVRLTVTNEFGCSHSYADSVKVLSLPRSDFSATEVCYGLPTIFASTSLPPPDAGLLSEIWDLGDGNSFSGPEHQHTFLQPGDYRVKLVVTGTNGCRDSLNKRIQVFPKPVLHFQAERDVGCSPFCNSITNLSGVGSGFIDKWIWNFSTGDTSSAFVPEICVENTDPYEVLNVHASLKALTNSGCTDSIYIENVFAVSPMPSADFFSSSDSVSILTPIVNFADSSIGAISWIWDFDDPANPTLSYLQHPQHEFSGTGEFRVRQIVFNNEFCADTASARIVVYPENYLFIPNTFTPDGDGINDAWKVTGSDFRSFEIQISNRWGQTVFQSSNPESAWDGTWQNSGAEQMQGMYPYFLRITDELGEEHLFRGFIRLIR